MDFPRPHPFSKTFAASAAILGLVAITQLAAAFWIFALEAAKKEQQRFALDRDPRATLGMSPAFLTTLSTASAPSDPTRSPSTLQEPDFTGGSALAPALARPTPITESSLANPRPAVAGLYEELLQQARLLRERGDMASALTKLREAQAIQPNNPEIISELAGTYEIMGLTDKAIEQWHRVHAFGPSAGILYSMAELKLQQGVQVPEAVNLDLVDLPFEEGADFALGPVRLEEDYDPNFSRTLRLQIPIKARQGIAVFEEEVVVQVFFYDIVDDTHVVQTIALRDFEWLSPPADWRDNNLEVLQVTYRLPFLTQEDADAGILKRDFLGYAVRVYYYDTLQTTAADPVRLLRDYPAPFSLHSTAIEPNLDPPFDDESPDR